RSPCASPVPAFARTMGNILLIAAPPQFLLILRARAEMNFGLSTNYPSFPRKRESRGQACGRLPWTPAFAGVTIIILILIVAFRSDTKIDPVAAPAARLDPTK